MTGQQLKDSILQWAIQGKLVPQDPTAEPASKLLERIRTEKAQLIKEGKLKKDQNSDSIIYRASDGGYTERCGDVEIEIDSIIPFPIPESWSWVRHNQLFDLSGGSQPPKSQFINSPKEGYIRLFQIRDYGDSPVPVYIPENKASKKTRKGDILLARYGASLGKVFFADDGAYNVAMAKVCPKYSGEHIHKDYLYIYYSSDIYQNAIRGNSRSAQAGFNKSDISDMLFPLPPLEEQKRIVARIEELMPLVEQYDKAHSELTRLNDQLPEQLKKSILQEAIQGKLVPQDPTDEPASELLERIRTEKAQLIKEGKMKKGQPTSHIYRDDEGSYYEKVGTKDPVCINHEIPFDLPASWEWCRLSDIAVYIQRGKSPKYSLIKKYPVVAQKCNQWDGFLIDKAKFIDPATLSKYTPERFLQDEDLMWNSTGLGTLGRMAVYYTALNPYELAVADSHVTVIRLLKSCVDPSFCYFYFINPTVQSVIENMSDGSTKQRELSTTTVRNFLVPLPPLEEQKRIVARIEELMPRIDKLR